RATRYYSNRYLYYLQTVSGAVPPYTGDRPGLGSAAGRRTGSVLVGSASRGATTPGRANGSQRGTTAEDPRILLAGRRRQEKTGCGNCLTAQGGVQLGRRDSVVASECRRQGRTNPGRDGGGCHRTEAKRPVVNQSLDAVDPPRIRGYDEV